LIFYLFLLLSNATLPGVAWIFLSDDHRGFKHSVVIKDIDAEASVIYYNDPAYGKVKEEILA